jgi:NADP-dependent 3-hydroxy acid dehydrogenase YdfG
MADEKTALSNGYSRIAIVTGASSGIGEATARKFIASGYGVICNARNAEKLSALEKELGQKAFMCHWLNRAL